MLMFAEIHCLLSEQPVSEQTAQPNGTAPYAGTTRPEVQCSIPSQPYKQRLQESQKAITTPRRKIGFAREMPWFTVPSTRRQRLAETASERVVSIMKSSHDVVPPLGDKKSADIATSTKERKGPVNSAGQRGAQPGPITKDCSLAARKAIPNSWTEIVKDQALWAELRDTILGSNED
jgi:hypothetical protein